MRGWWLAWLVLVAAAAQARPRFDVIDVHFHADLPDAEGGSGGHICAPYDDWAPRDPAAPIERYLDWFTLHPSCRHLLTAPTYAAELRDHGLSAPRRNHVLALAGGRAATVEDYRVHAPT